MELLDYIVGIYQLVIECCYVGQVHMIVVHLAYFLLPSAQRSSGMRGMPHPMPAMGKKIRSTQTLSGKASLIITAPQHQKIRNRTTPMVAMKRRLRRPTSVYSGTYNS